MKTVSIKTERIEVKEMSEEDRIQLEQINAFMVKLKDTNRKFGELSIYTGSGSVSKEIGSIAACVYQEHTKPIIFIADSKTTTQFNLNKKELRAIMYHEHAHYSLGHIALDTPTPNTLEAYIQQESDTDLKAVELAVENGIDRDKMAFTLALALAKMAASMVIKSFVKKIKINQQAMESIDKRVEALEALYEDSQYKHLMLEFQKKVVRRLVTIAVKTHGATTKEQINQILKGMEA